MKRTRLLLLAALLTAIVVYWPIAALAVVAFTSAGGTTQTSWSVGGTLGPMWNDNSGALEAKDPTNSFFEVVRGATPVSNNDLTTKNYTDAHPLVGDVTGTLGANVLTTMTGSSGVINIVATYLAATQSNTGLTIGQPAQANGSNPVSLTLAPQAPGAGASTTATGTPGSLVVSLSAPVSTGVESELQVSRAGTNIARLGPYTNGNPTWGALWLGGTSTTNTMALLGDGTNTTLNAGSGSGTVFVNVGGSSIMALGAGGHGFANILNSFSAPTSAPASGADFYGNGGNFELWPASGAFQFAQAVSSPTITQPQQANGSNPNSLTIAPQAPGAGASTAATGTPGSLVVNLSAPVSTGAEAALTIKRAGTFNASLGPYNGSPTYGALYLGTTVDGAMLSNGNQLYIGRSVNDVWIQPGNYFFHVAGGGGPGRGNVLGYPGTMDAGGGDNVVTVSPVLTVPSSALSSANDVTFYDNAGFFELYSKGLQWNYQQSSPTISQTTPVSDVATQNLTIQSQAPFASATTNKSPGNINLTVPAPLSSAPPGFVNILPTGSNGASNGAFQFGSTPAGSNNGVSYMWAGLDGATPSTSNYVISAWNSQGTILNGIAGNLYFNVGSTQIGQATSSGIQFGSGAAAFGSGTSNIVGLTNSTGASTSTCSGGICFYANSGNFEIDAPTWQWPKFITAPTIAQNAQTTDVATHSMTIKAQNAWGSATTNVTGAALTLSGGSGTNSFNGGTASLVSGDGSTQLSIAATGSGVSGSLSASVLFNNVASTLTADVAPQGVGGPNSQNMGSQKKRIFCRTSASGLFSCGGFAFTVPSNTVASFTVRWTARDVTSNNNANDGTGMCVAAVHNQSGALNGIGASAGSCTSVWAILGTGNTTSNAFTYTMSGSTVRFNVGGYTITDNIDWTLDVDMTLD